MPSPGIHFVSTLLAASLIFIAPSEANAAPRKATFAIESTNNTGIKTTDFHIDLRSDTNISVLGSTLVDPNGNHIAGTTSNDNSKSIQLDWDVSVENGQSVSASGEFSQEEKNDYAGIGYFTPKHSPTDIPFLGWRIDANGDVFLLNGFTSGIHFSDLFFQFPGDIASDSMFDLLSAPLSGTTGLLSAGTVAASSGGVAGEILVAQFSFLAPGDFLSARLDTSFTDSEFSSLTSTEAFGHEHQVTEPSTAALLALAFAGLFATANLKRR